MGLVAFSGSLANKFLLLLKACQFRPLTTSVSHYLYIKSMFNPYWAH